MKDTQTASWTPFPAASECRIGSPFSTVFNMDITIQASRSYGALRQGCACDAQIGKYQAQRPRHTLAANISLLCLLQTNWKKARPDSPLLLSV
jgi:hypothetical protein